ncbi:hypothetical protein L2E82_27529 [Cichorium intybus]|uniref:Uncharacterized protein n=1 Tax=Cichorium intybus TaxID=13427 RepID=A0ACB9CTI6_CICIN|nr:hypothetical protein L2E82_27529 [Cichorium intybus]
MGFDNTLSLLTGGCGFLWVLSTAWNCFFVNKYHEHIGSAMLLFVTEKSFKGIKSTKLTCGFDCITWTLWRDMLIVL